MVRLSLYFYNCIFITSFLNIVFGWLSMLCFMIPIFFALFGGKKAIAITIVAEVNYFYWVIVLSCLEINLCLSGCGVLF